MNAIHLLRYRSKIQTQRSLLQMSAFHYSVIALYNIWLFISGIKMTKTNTILENSIWLVTTSILF